MAARSSQTVNTLVRGTLVVYDSTDTPVTGLTDGSFTKFAALNGADNSITITVTEIANGRYGYSFTPNAVGYWHILIRNAANNPRGWSDEFDVS